VRTGTAFLRVQLHLGAWLWAVVAAVAVVLAVIQSRTGAIEGGTWQNVDQGPRWFLFAMSLIMVTGYLPAHVANGMTRRSFTAALTAVMAVTSAAYGLLWTLGYLVEGLLSVGGPPAGVLALGLQGVLLFAVYAASGMLVGATYYRAGAWWGTLTLPLTVGPVLLAEVWASGSRAADVLPAAARADGLPMAVASLLLLLLAAVLATAAHGLIRDVPIRTRLG
jgi:hypothetical protein